MKIAWVVLLPSLLISAAQAAPAELHAWPMHKVSVVDEAASQAGIAAATLLAPPDWSAHGAGNYVMDCVFSPPRLNLIVMSPDHGIGLHVYPGMVAAWSDNPQVAASYRTSYPEFSKTKTCQVDPPLSIDARLRKSLATISAQAVGNTQPVPGVEEELRANVQKLNAKLAATPNAGTVTAEAGRLRYSANRDGKAIEGWLVLVISTRHVPVPNGQGTLQLIDAPLICEMYAPPGKLDANEKMLTAMLGTIQLQPDWLRYEEQDSLQVQQIIQQAYQRVANIHNQMMQDNLRTQQNIAAIRRGTADYARQVHENVASNRQAALDHSSQQFSLYMGDQAIYKNPSTGERVQMSAGYEHAWAGSGGSANEYILTDSAGYDPNVYPNGHVGSSGWTELQQEH